tara:strand:- start:452 stop:1051 length:600 start_codon:yes stop_codon:yes gene_type:complete
MKKYFLITFTSCFFFFTASVSWTEPNFFFQTLTTNFVDWFFGKIDKYVSIEASEENKNQNKEITNQQKKPPKEERISENDLVKRHDIFYKKFTNVPFSGFVETYHKNGQLKTIGQLIKGKRNSLWEEYYSNGRQRSIGHYKMGIKEGSWNYYFLNSQLKEKQFYKEGKKDGLWETFDSLGTLVKTESYRKGEWIITTLN